MTDHPNENALATRILVIDGSLEGPNGNSMSAVRSLLAQLERTSQSTPLVSYLHLKDGVAKETIEAAVRSADGFLFVSGTYWDSWGSPLQKFLEDFTHLEGTDAWLGKPAAVLITMHSVGGKAVLSRLQGVLNTLGLQIPPMTGFTYSFATHLALRTEEGGTDADLWKLEDLDRVAHNLLVAVERNRHPLTPWSAWSVDQGDARKKWLE